MNSEKEVLTDNFKIEKNIICFNESLIQISSISLVSIEPVPRKKFHLESILALIIGGFLYLSSRNAKELGLLIIVIVIVYLSWYLLFNMGSNKKYLYIYLNSGQSRYFICDDEVFLEHVVNVIKYCINNHSVSKVKIDFENCKIYNSPITIGNRNEVNQ